MLKKSTSKLAALFVVLCMALTLMPMAVFAEDERAIDNGQLTVDNEGNGETKTTEATEDSGDKAASEATDAAEPSEDSMDESTEDPSEAAVEAAPAVTITITGESEYGDALYLDSGVAVTDTMLLAGVSAADENGEAVAVAVADVGGLDRENPQPKGEPGNPEAYIITYAAEGAKAVTRECFVTVGVVALASGGATIDMNDNTITDDTRGTGWSYTGDVYTIENGANVTVTGDNGSSRRRIVVANNATATITLDDLTITGASPSPVGTSYFTPFGLPSGANVTLTLKGTSTLTGGDAFPGISVPDAASLTIEGDGVLNAESAGAGAGIGGGGFNSDCGNITINGGTINAKSSGGSADIGARADGKAGAIIINGGTVNADIIGEVGDDSMVIYGVTGVTLDEANLTLTVGRTGTLNETVLPTKATNKAVTWKSSNPAIATVADGVVTPVAEGSATITVTTDGGRYTADCVVTVNAAVTPPPVRPEPTRPAPRPNYDRDDDNDGDSAYTAPRLPAPTHTLRKGDGYYDTMLGGTVEVRLYDDRPVSGYTSGTDVTRVRATFEKWFTNPVRSIHFDQTGKWEQPVKVAAKIDLAGMDATKLVFYYYDPKLGIYRKLAAPAYWIDGNEYLHFQTEYAGEIVIAEGELEKK